jgi:hypothetical protein
VASRRGVEEEAPALAALTRRFLDGELDRKEAVRRARAGAAPSGPWHLFRADIVELVVTHLNESRDRLVIEFWREVHGLRRVER